MVEMGSGRSVVVERGQGWWLDKCGEASGENAGTVGSGVMVPRRLTTMAYSGAAKVEKGGGWWHGKRSFTRGWLEMDADGCGDIWWGRCCQWWSTMGWNLGIC